MSASTKRTQESYERFYSVPSVVKRFGETARLSPAEAAILSLLQNELRGQPILDLGIGAGRTIPYLRDLSSNYIGVDLSAKMIDSARERFPDATLLECDATDLSMFHADQFAAVFFLGAGIDEVDPMDRMKIIRETHRVLKAGGVFVLCAHNLGAREASPWSFFDYSSSSNPAAFVRDNVIFLWCYFSSIWKILRNRVSGHGYIVFTEYEDGRAEHPDLSGSLLPTCYIRSDAQIRQLLQAGFCSAEARGKNGCLTDAHTTGRDHFLYYVSRKGNSPASSHNTMA